MCVYVLFPFSASADSSCDTAERTGVLGRPPSRQYACCRSLRLARQPRPKIVLASILQWQSGGGSSASLQSPNNPSKDADNPLSSPLFSISSHALFRKTPSTASSTPSSPTSSPESSQTSPLKSSAPRFTSARGSQPSSSTSSPSNTPPESSTSSSSREIRSSSG